MIRNLTAIAAVGACAAALAAGCGSDPEETPSACLTGSEDYVRILARAPDGVAFDDGTTISECLVPEQSGGQLAQVGEEMIAAATTPERPGARGSDRAWPRSSSATSSARSRRARRASTPTWSAG